jgi:hypothetical protein
VAAVLERAPALGVGDDWWLTAGVLFQAVWNELTGRPPGTGVWDADLFYFDADTSWDAEDVVIRRGAELFGDLAVPVEVRNEARVHLWYADRFGTPPAPFRDCADAIDAIAGVCCCFGVTVDCDRPRVYAPYGYADLFGLVVRPTRGALRRGTCTRPRRPAGPASGPGSRSCPGRPAPRGVDGCSQLSGGAAARAAGSRPVPAGGRRPAAGRGAAGSWCGGWD